LSTSAFTQIRRAAPELKSVSSPSRDVAINSFVNIDIIRIEKAGPEVSGMKRMRQERKLLYS
jgi:hypothetical protein